MAEAQFLVGPVLEVLYPVACDRILAAGFSALGWKTAEFLFGALMLLSAGMGIANLIPFDGSDGQEIFSALKAMRRRRRP